MARAKKSTAPRQNGSCPCCGATYTETHWALWEMGGSEPAACLHGVCPKGCDESEQRWAWEDYLASEGRA